MTYPRFRNGHMDDGSLIQASNRRDHCPNCGSHNYRETVSMESCDACGLRMDYWGGGGNTVYEAYLARHHAAVESQEWARREAEERAWRELEQECEHWRWHYDDNCDL
jgi:uncharacterized protein (DUF983 family)